MLNVIVMAICGRGVGDHQRGRRMQVGYEKIATFDQYLA